MRGSSRNARPASRRTLVPLLLAAVFASVLGAERAAAISSDPDLDITYIERTPRQAKNCVTSQSFNYPSGGLQTSYYIDVPAVCDTATYQNPNDEPHWPAAGSVVTFWGHVMNKGDAISEGGTYQWYIDDGSPLGEQPYGPPGDLPCTSSPPCEIPPGGEVVVTTTYEWPDTNHTTHVYPQLRLEITPAGDDAFGSNDSRLYFILGKSLVFFVRQDWYDLFNSTLNGSCADTGTCPYPEVRGTYSYEDWLQRQIAGMNLLLENSTAPEAPQGALERLNLDKVVVAPNDSTDAQYVTAFEATNEPALVPANPPKRERVYNYDAAWHQPGVPQPDADPATSPSFQFIEGWEGGLTHELSHRALGAIDMYNMPIQWTADGTCTAGIMFWHAGGGPDPDCLPFRYEVTHVLYFNKRLAIRGGWPGAWFGDFMLQTPDENVIELKTSGGQHVENVEVTVQQRTFHQTNQAVYTVGQGRTDAAGRFVLPEQPSHVFASQAGYSQPSENAFGNIHTWGHNGWLYLTFTLEDGTILTGILDKPQVVLEAERGHDPAYYPFVADPPSKGPSPPSFTSLTIGDGSHPLVRRVDAGVSADTTRVDFFVDGVLRGRDTTAPFQYDWDTRFEALGKHWISARAYKTSPQLTFTLSPNLTGSYVDPADGSVSATPISPASTFGANLALSGTASVSGVGGGGVSAINDGNTATSWNSSGAGEGDWVQIYLGAASQQVRGIRLRNLGNLADECMFDLYVTDSPPDGNSIPVVSRRFTDRLQPLELAFPVTSGRYVRLVCRGADNWLNINEFEVLAPAQPPPPLQIKSVSAALSYTTVGGIAQPAANAAISWPAAATAGYYQVCTDTVSTFTTCNTVAATVLGTSANVPFPATDGAVTYVKVRACTALDTCSAVSATFAGVGRVITGGVNFAYAFDGTADDVRVQFTSLSTDQAVRLYLAQGTIWGAHDTVGAAPCLDAATGWTSPAPVSVRGWKLGSAAAATYGVPDGGTCAGTSTPQIAAGRAFSVPTRLPGPSNLTFAFQGGFIGRISWSATTGADHYRVCQSTTLTFASNCTSPTTSTSYHDIAVTIVSARSFFWLVACDAADVCGPASRSYITVQKQQASGFGYWWAYYKTNTTFGFQVLRPASVTQGLALHVYAGDSVAAPLVISTNCVTAAGEVQPGGSQIPGVSQVYALAGDLVASPNITVARHAVGTDCTDHSVHNTTVAAPAPVRQRPAAPAGLDIAMDATGSGTTVYRTKLDWPDDQNVAWYRYCSSSTGVTVAFSCPPSIIFKKSYQYFINPSGTTPVYFRVVACDVDFYCSALSSEYIGLQRSTASGDFTYAYRRSATSIKLQMMNFSWYYIPLWVKLHAQHGSAPEINVCSRPNPGDGPISAPVEVARDPAATALTVLRHPIGDFWATTCAAADTTPTDHSGDTLIGTPGIGDANVQYP